MFTSPLPSFSDNHHYATWNRTRRLQQSPFIARSDSNVARAAAAMHSGMVGSGDAVNNSKDKKVQESLFGPNIGVVSSGPAWTAASEKKVLTDELTPDIVNGWIEKSKDVSPISYTHNRKNYSTSAQAPLPYNRLTLF
jgi:hypothetical protein